MNLSERGGNLSRILLLGVSVRALAESAVKSGYPVMALDAFGDYDLQALCEAYSLSRDFNMPYSARNLFRASRKLTFDGFSYTANLENHPSVVDDFSQSASLLGNHAETLKRVRHWPGLFSFLNREGYLTPETHISDDSAKDGEDRQWLIKPLRSGSGRGISFWKPGKKIRPGFMLQEYIAGRPCSASFISNGSEAVLIGTTEQICGLPTLNRKNFLYRGNILPLDIQADGIRGKHIIRQLQQISTRLTSEFGLLGFNGIDFILVNDKIYITEVNPRYCASMELIERAYHLPVFDLHYRAVTRGELPNFDIKSAGMDNGGFIVKSILYAERDGCAPDTGDWFARGVRDIPHAGESLYKNKPVCTIFARGDTRDACLANLTRETDEINREIYG